MSAKRNVVLLTILCWALALGFAALVVSALGSGVITRFGRTFTPNDLIYWVHIVFGSLGCAILVWVSALSTRSLLAKRPFK